MPATDQREHAAWMRAATETVNADVARLTAGLDDETLHRRPPAGGWSIAEVFEHLCIAADSYLDLLEREIGRAKGQPAAAPGEAWKPSFLGGVLIRSLQPASTRKVRAPKAYQPGPEPRPDVVAEFLRRQAATLDLLDRGEGLAWRRIRTSSPISRLIRLNLGDAYTLLVVHAQRHMLQVARVRAAVMTEPAPAA